MLDISARVAGVLRVSKVFKNVVVSEVPGVTYVLSLALLLPRSVTVGVVAVGATPAVANDMSAPALTPLLLAATTLKW